MTQLIIVHFYTYSNLINTRNRFVVEPHPLDMFKNPSYIEN